MIFVSSFELASGFQDTTLALINNVNFLPHQAQDLKKKRMTASTFLSIFVIMTMMWKSYSTHLALKCVSLGNLVPLKLL